jgi:serine protease DegQ
MRRFWVAALLAACCLAPPAWADEGKKVEKKTFQVPYRLTNFNHVMVRAKLNGKGPFNFIVDTGAPALFVATKPAKQAGVEADKKGWGTFDTFEIEGGVLLEKAKGRVEDPFQLEGMNGMGLAGAELHGMIGYQLLARYRIEFDFSKSKMTWTELDFEPEPPERLDGKASMGGLDAMGQVMKFLGGLLGAKPNPDVVPRGFLGIEIAEDGKNVVVKSVLAKGPAALAGVKAGDRITEFDGRTVREHDDLHRFLARLRAGQKTSLTVERGGDTKEITLKLGEGL